MRILVGCEESQAVCMAFRAEGHEAYSCDLKPCSGGHPEWHIQGDVFEVIESQHWDMLIGHPVCKYLTNAGVLHLFTDGKLDKKGERWQGLEAGCKFFLKMWNCGIERICLENPIPHKHAIKLIGVPYTQKVQPYNFGVTETKATCYWLKNIPPLMFTIDAREAMAKLPKKDTHKVHYMSPGKDRSELRSKTYPEIARQKALQWGDL